MADDRILARMAALREKFVGELCEDRDTLHSLRVRPDARKALTLLLHRLAGRAGTFGFAEISDLAGRAEALAADEGLFAREAGPLLDALDAAIAAAAGSGRK